MTVPDPQEDDDEIPVVEIDPPAQGVAARPESAPPPRDWTRTDGVRNDPGSLAQEALKLWEAVRDQFVNPVLENYPEAAGHLSTAGSEITAAVRALIRGDERRWMGTRDPRRTGDEDGGDGEGPDDPA
jgi:Family of unknown function (DUF5304)